MLSFVTKGEGVKNDQNQRYVVFGRPLKLGGGLMSWDMKVIVYIF